MGFWECERVLGCALEVGAEGSGAAAKEGLMTAANGAVSKLFKPKRVKKGSFLAGLGRRFSLQSGSAFICGTRWRSGWYLGRGGRTPASPSRLFVRLLLLWSLNPAFWVRSLPQHEGNTCGGSRLGRRMREARGGELQPGWRDRGGLSHSRIVICAVPWAERAPLCRWN